MCWLMLLLVFALIRIQLWSITRLLPDQCLCGNVFVCMFVCLDDYEEGWCHAKAYGQTDRRLHLAPVWVAMNNFG